jgi:hypothetical protein
MLKFHVAKHAQTKGKKEQSEGNQCVEAQTGKEGAKPDRPVFTRFVHNSLDTVKKKELR